MLAFQTLVLWARKHRLVIGDLSVGSVHATLIDVSDGPSGPPRAPEPRRSLYEEFGGDAISEALKSGGESTDLEEDEED